jgi:hypothetical protein
MCGSFRAWFRTTSGWLLLISQFLLFAGCLARAARTDITATRQAGDLAAVHPMDCMPLAQASNALAPPDIYKGGVDCIAKADYESAAKLFLLADVYAKFDTFRIADKTAGDSPTVLVMNALVDVSEEKKRNLLDAITQINKDPERLRRLCEEVRTIGMPNYYPRYMILHGMRAHSSRDPEKDALLKDFDAVGTWNKLQAIVLRCSKAPSPQ